MLFFLFFPETKKKKDLGILQDGPFLSIFLPSSLSSSSFLSFFFSSNIPSHGGPTPVEVVRPHHPDPRKTRLAPLQNYCLTCGQRPQYNILLIWITHCGTHCGQAHCVQRGPRST